MMQLERALGLYGPKGRELTASRKRSIRRHFLELDELARNAVFAEYPRGSSAQARKEIRRNLSVAYPGETEEVFGQPTARKRAGKATKKGVFVPRSEKQIVAPIGKMQFDRETGLYVVKVRKKTKSGMYAQETRYIAKSDILEKRVDRLQKKFDRMGKLKKNQRLRFLIGRNESRRTFRTMRELVNYAKRYRRDPQARATFLDQLTIEIVQKGTPRTRTIGRGTRRDPRRTVRDPWTVRDKAFRADNFHEVDPDLIADMLEEMGDDEESDE